MIRGLSGKIVIFSLQKQEVTYIIYQMKDIISLYLMMYFILSKKNCRKKMLSKKVFFCLLFSNVHISTNVILDGLKF